MSQLIHDISAFLLSLSLIDYILYFAVLVLLVLIISLIYIMKAGDDVMEPEAVMEHDSIDLNEIIETIEENNTKPINMTSYEEEQEEKAIISYDELIENAKTYPINYDTEELVDNEIKVKKINLDQLANKESTEEPKKIEVKLIKYEKEEAFLKELKQLSEILN